MRNIFKVAVLMSTYNGSKYLYEQVFSIMSQKDVEINLFIRDDGSTDGTLDILSSLSSRFENMHYFVGQNINVTLSYQELLKKTDGFDYYAFADQDDVWEESKIISAILKLNVENSYKLYFSSLKIVDENLVNLGTHRISQFRSNLARLIFSGAAGCTMVFNDNLRRKLINYVPDSKNFYHDEWAIKSCILLGGYIVADIDSHILYRQHNNNTVGISNKFMSKVKKTIKNTSEISYKNQILQIADNLNNEIDLSYIPFIKLVEKYEKSLVNRLRLAFYVKGFKSIYYRVFFIVRVLIGRL